MARHGVAVDHRGEHRPQLLPARSRPRRGDLSQTSTRWRPRQLATMPPGTLAAGRAAVRPDEHDPDRAGDAPERDAGPVDALRRGAVRGPEHDHDQPRRRSRRWSSAARSGRSCSTSTARSSRPAEPVAAGRHGGRWTSSTCSSPPATPSSATLDYAIDSNSMYDVVGQDGGHAAADEVRQRGRTSRTSRRPRTPPSSRPTSSGSATPGGRVAARSTSRSSASSGRAPSRSSTRSSRSSRSMQDKLSAAGDQPQAGHGPVDLRPAVDHASLVQEGLLGAVLCSLTILMFLGELQDDRRSRS